MSASSIARKQREQLSESVEQGQSAATTKSLRPQEESLDDRLARQQLTAQPPIQNDVVPVQDTLSTMPTAGTTAALHRQIEKIDIINDKFVSTSSMTPLAKPEHRKNNKSLQIEVEKRIKEQVAELEKVKRRLADAEAKVTVRKGAAGRGAEE